MKQNDTESRLHLPEQMGITSTDRMNFQTVDEFYKASASG